MDVQGKTGRCVLSQYDVLINELDFKCVTGLLLLTKCLCFCFVVLKVLQ